MANFELEEGTTIRVTADFTRNASAVLNQIGAFLTSRSQQAFRDQSFDGETWPPRLVPNVPGIVKDLNAGAPPKGRRFQPRPALIDTGTLRNSISWSVQGPNSVVVGSTLPYASIHQTGGITKPVELASSGRSALGKLLGSRPDLGESLGHLFNQPLVVRNVPARPFVGVQSGDVQEIESIIAGAIT